MNLTRIEPIEETKEELCLKCGLKVGEQGQYAYARESDLVIVCEPCVSGLKMKAVDTGQNGGR